MTASVPGRSSPSRISMIRLRISVLFMRRDCLTRTVPLRKFYAKTIEIRTCAPFGGRPVHFYIPRECAFLSTNVSLLALKRTGCDFEKSHPVQKLMVCAQSLSLGLASHLRVTACHLGDNIFRNALLSEFFHHASTFFFAPLFTSFFTPFLAPLFTSFLHSFFQTVPRTRTRGRRPFGCVSLVRFSCRSRV